MCSSWAFCLYQRLLKNLTDNRINQIKNIKTNFEVSNLLCNGTVLQ